MDSQELPDNVCLLAIFMGELSISDPISMPTQCKIVSSSVDIRSSKVCELGLLNYKAKHVFYSSENSKFRCRYDYYWTSVFKVEYTDHSLDQMQLALTEAPNEALPVSCRPDFGVAWLTKDKFKVNETYDCWYILGTTTVKMYNDGFFSCQAKDPSLTEMMKRYLILSIKILKSWFSSEGYARYWKSEAIAGIVTGFSTSIITISFIRTLQHMKSWLPQAINTLHIKRAALIFYVLFSPGNGFALTHAAFPLERCKLEWLPDLLEQHLDTACLITRSREKDKIVVF
ncbi:Exopolysaccharide production negative regulator [Gossypium arboreum]|uniref:Exopolysaccharide production negative regulator n=1 Tax=Gossypium arboreum TaxID=29729 RepID=A0A0B0MW82_GOSAR|nr:Exopolysaccharide production negative regulator [Gossypium arboreum]